MSKYFVYHFSKFILISTDKATNPTSTLGASKLLAERLTLNANSYKGRGKTIFSVVRFGNVMETRGNVFEAHKFQWKKKHFEMYKKKFFVSVSLLF
ncbi:MAG: polysaccharide biosynthesis protein [Thaumarchaeota archaeon]|nr:polysaccharide biosynthesis protein [Nitrososphaerota archaeon]